jgi:hypothetical protein
MVSQIDLPPGPQADLPKKDLFTLEMSNQDGSTAVDTEVGESYEIFQANVNAVEFRTVSWQQATVLFVKINFAMSILSTPGALAVLGSVGGSLSIIGFTSLNTCKSEDAAIEDRTSWKLTMSCLDTAVVLGDFHHRHPECHSKPAPLEINDIRN